MTDMSTEPTHGGTRAGAGRPPSEDPRKAFPLRLRAEPAARIRAEAARRDGTPADVIEDLAATLPPAPAPKPRRKRPK